MPSHAASVASVASVASISGISGISGIFVMTHAMIHAGMSGMSGMYAIVHAREVQGMEEMWYTHATQTGMRWHGTMAEMPLMPHEMASVA